MTINRADQKQRREN